MLHTNLRLREIGLFAMAIVLGGFAVSAKGQAVTGTTFLSNINPSDPSYSGAWNDPTKTTVSSTSTGLEFAVNPGTNQTTGNPNPNSFTQMTYNIPAGQLTPLNTDDNSFTFNFTWNSGNAVAGVNVIAGLIDAQNNANYFMSTYVVPTPGLNSYTFSDLGGLAADVAAGTTITSINLQIDPSNVSGPYDITYNSLTFTPEPASLGLIALSGIGLLARRRSR